VVYQALADKAPSDDIFETYIRRACDVYLRAIAIKAVVVKANDHDGDFYDANLNLSACYFQLGKYHEAEEYCQTAIAINDDNPLGWTNLGTIYDNQNKYTEAIAAYRQSLERDVNQPRLHMNLGSAYIRQGWLKDAIGSFKAAARMDPKSTQPYIQMGVCYYRMKELDNAVDAYLSAAKIDPKSSEAYRGLGVAYMAKFLNDQAKTDLRDKSLAAWKRSLELNPRQDDLLALVNKYTPKYEEPKL
jgi:tetratricopeptide (TPR) repeat protein